MNSEDYAIVVGIDDYRPPYERLNGARRDATEFINWLKSPDGGNLPPQNVDPYTTLSTEDGSSPVFSELLRLFGSIRQLAPPDQRRIGRRIYIFVSGHSLSPGEPGEVGLVTLESDEALTSVFPVRHYADRLCLGRHFDEVLLFMDCCRPRHPGAAMGLPFRLSIEYVADEHTKRFYVFSNSVGRIAREEESSEGVRGIFSRQLIEGLRTGADGEGHLTTSGLRAFLERRLASRLSDGEEQVPHFAACDEIVLLAGRAPRLVSVNLDFSDPAPANLLILDGAGNLASVQPPHLKLAPTGATFSLASGRRYVVQGLDTAGAVLRTLVVTAAEDDIDERL